MTIKYKKNNGDHWRYAQSGSLTSLFVTMADGEKQHDSIFMAYLTKTL